MPDYVNEELPDLPAGYEWLVIAIPVGPRTTLSQMQREATKAVARKVRERISDG